MECMMVSIILGTAVIVAAWHIVQLSHYLGWRQYDSENSTEYRFNEGAPRDWVFRVPPYLEWLLRRLERDTKLGAKFRDPAR